MNLFLAVVLALEAALVSAGPEPHLWWKEAVVYQVFPASFKESRTGEAAIGWGDINGITEKLDHIQTLGVDILWLSPFYDSPLKDMGYDISDYDRVNPKFGGSLLDVQRLIKECHRRGMRFIVDLVINHTSDEHRWFQQSSNSTTSPYHDWYIWRPPRYVNGSIYPPNNWSGSNNGSAWKYVPAVGQYYLNLFNPFQPDLNWDNPVTREAILHDAVGFWLDQDIDGFRMDAFSLFSKPAGLPNVTVDCDMEFCNARPLYNDGPHEAEYLQQMNREYLQGRDTFTVGEYGNTYNMSIVQGYTDPERHEINTIFLTNVVDLARIGNTPAPYTLAEFREAVNFTEAAGSAAAGRGWNTVFLENHDQARSISRFLNDSAEYRVQGGKLLSMLLTTLSGTLFVYQQQEIGMINVPSNWTLSDYRDTLGLNAYKNETDSGIPAPQALEDLRALARDNTRTPFNWNRTSGFSTNSTTWTPVANLDINLADQIVDPNSVYQFWTASIGLRKRYKDLFVYGGFEFLDLQSENFLVYQKINVTEGAGPQKALVILNMSAKEGEPPFNVPGDAELLSYTHAYAGDLVNSSNETTFQAYEGRVYLTD